LDSGLRGDGWSEAATKRVPRLARDDDGEDDELAPGLRRGDGESNGNGIPAPTDKT